MNKIRSWALLRVSVVCWRLAERISLLNSCYMEDTFSRISGRASSTCLPLNLCTVKPVRRSLLTGCLHSLILPTRVCCIISSTSSSVVAENMYSQNMWLPGLLCATACIPFLQPPMKVTCWEKSPPYVVRNLILWFNTQNVIHTRVCVCVCVCACACACVCVSAFANTF